MDTPYAVLGLPRGASEEEIRRAYRERVIETHPDQGGSASEFQAVRRAYEQLTTGETVEGGSEDGEGAVHEGSDDAGEAIADTQVTYLNYDVLTDHGWAPDDPDLFETAARAGLDEEDFGGFAVSPGESLLEAAENRGHAWPFACRGGACANCAVYLRQGEVSMPVNHVLPREMMESNIRLSCNAMPVTDELAVIYNIKHMPELEELLLPPRPFEQAHAGD